MKYALGSSGKPIRSPDGDMIVTRKDNAVLGALTLLGKVIGAYTDRSEITMSEEKRLMDRVNEARKRVYGTRPDLKVVGDDD